MDRAAGEALIGSYQPYEGFFPRTDTTDRHVAAVAIAAGDYRPNPARPYAARAICRFAHWLKSGAAPSSFENLH